MEKHFIKHIQECTEFPLYKHLFSRYPHECRKILKVLSGRNRLYGPADFAATMEAHRCSGEMNTSLGNGWANYVIFAFLVSEKGGDFEGYVEGDDGIFATNVEITQADYARCGFEVKVIEHKTVSTASFCGIVSAPGGVLLKDPVRFMQGFGWTSSFIDSSDDVMLALLRAKALSAVYEAPQCPIIGAIARAALSRTRGVLPKFIQDGYHDTSAIPRDEKKLAVFDPTPEVRQLFSHLYGVTPAQQIMLENEGAAGNFVNFEAILRPHHDNYHYEQRYIVAG